LTLGNAGNRIETASAKHEIPQRNPGAYRATRKGQRLFCLRRGGAYFVAGVFADVGDNPINWRRHLLANPIRLFGITNHPPTGTPSSLRLLNKFKTSFPLQKLVTHEFPVDQVDEAMPQAFDIDACMKVVLKRSGG
jgi:threonine dehydrogenase-like Zn-dependent dehydrogenase